MYRSQSFKKPLSVLMVTSLLTLSAPVFSATGTGSGCVNCPEKPTVFQQAPAPMEHPVSTKTPMSSTMVIPAGTALSLREVGQTPTMVGDRFRAELTAPLVINGVTVAPVGTQISGEVMAVNTTTNTIQLDLQNVSTPSGENIPIRGQGNVTARGQIQTIQTPQGTQYVAAAPYQGGVQVNAAGANLGMPYLHFGRGSMTPGEKIVAGTLGGAVFGGAVGTLSGLVMPAVYSSDIDYNSGTGAARGLAWGAVMGAGLGLVTGVIAAAADRDDACVTSTCPVPVAVNPCPTPVAVCPAPCPEPVTVCPAEPCAVTNISSGSIQERPVAYPTGTTTIVGPREYTLILEDDITITR